MAGPRVKPEDVPAIHVFNQSQKKTWMLATSASMTLTLDPGHGSAQQNASLRRSGDDERFSEILPALPLQLGAAIAGRGLILSPWSEPTLLETELPVHSKP